MHLSEQLHTTATQWSQPSTPEQIRFFSKFAPQRKVQGIIALGLQIVHAIIGFPAWVALFNAGFEKTIPSLMVLSVPLGIIALLTLHTLMAVRWETYFYDKWDNDPSTESSIFPSLLIAVLIIAVDGWGAMMFLEGNVKPANEKPATSIYAEADGEMAKIDALYNSKTAAIESTYKAKAEAATLPYQAKIKALKSRRIDSDSERRSIRGQIIALETKRDEALAPILAAKAEALERETLAANQLKTNADSRKAAALATIDGHNSSEAARVAAEKGRAPLIGFALSLVLMFVILLIRRSNVRINVKSGILPTRTFSILDQYGGPWERFALVFKDILNRQSFRAAVALHRAGTGGGALTDFDHRVVALPGNYNGAGKATANSPTPVPDDYEERIRIVQELAAQGAALSTENLDRALTDRRRNTATKPPAPQTAAAPVIQRITDSENINEMERSEDIFFHWRTKFYADTGNMKNRNGDIRSIAKRLKVAAEKMLENLDAVNNRRQLEDTYRYIIDKFWPTHFHVFDTYTVELPQTPLNEYYDTVEALNKAIYTKLYS